MQTTATEKSGVSLRTALTQLHYPSSIRSCLNGALQCILSQAGNLYVSSIPSPVRRKACICTAPVQLAKLS